MKFNKRFFKIISCTILILFYFSGCTVPNPDFSEEIKEQLMGGSLISTAGDQAAGDQVAGDQVAGDQVAGDQVAGDQVAGDQVAGDQVAGDQVAGDQVAGDQIAGTLTTDQDGDGYAEPEDCDDQNAEIYPGHIEICDGYDQDCDGQVDEDLTEVCFALLSTVNSPADVTLLGDELFLVDDLDGDGLQDVLVRGRRNRRARLLALSTTGEILWGVNGDGDFAQAVASGDFIGDGSIQIIAADPENDRAVVYNQLGQTIATFPITDGRVSSLVTLHTAEGIDLLAVGMPERYASRQSTRTQGRIVLLRFDPAEGLGNPEVLYARNGESLQKWGERMFNLGDFDADGVDDLVFTRVIVFENRNDIGTQLLSGAEGETSVDSLFFTFDETYSSFASALTYGRLAPDGAKSFVFGAPLVSDGSLEGGALYTLSVRPEGVFEEESLYGGRESDELGSRLATLPRPNESTDLLLIAGRRGIISHDPSTQEIKEIHTTDTNLLLGKGLVVSSRPNPDGTYRMWVTGISDQGGQSLVWIYSAR